jgi:hypothetical protein
VAERALTAKQDRELCRFIDGYFSEQFALGIRPDYGYPKNHLPETILDSMEVVTGFMAAAE